MSYTVIFGERISDACLNSTGDISIWDSLLAKNGFDSWTPDLTAGQILQTPVVVNPLTLPVLTSYPANNSTVSNVDDLIAEVYAILATSTPSTPPVIVPHVIDTNKYYIIEYGESAGDWVLNSTGNNTTWNAIAQANGWDTWTPSLQAGDMIIIPVDALPDPNSLRALITYPTNNATVPDVFEQINVIFDILLDRWILRTNFWDDLGIWIDSDKWND